MMDVSYLSPGAYVPYYASSGGFVVARSPSPPLSLCSEPILQLPMSDGRNGNAGQQLKTPKIQLLNKTLVDARRKKSAARGHNKAPRVEPPDISNFFQSTIPFSDYTSESGEGSLKGGRDSPKFRCTPTSFFFPSSPYQWQQLDTRFQFPRCEERQMRIIQVANPPIITNHQFQQHENNIQLPFPTLQNNANITVNDPREKMIKKQTSKDTDPPSSERVKRKNVKNCRKPTPKLSFPKKKKVLISGIKAITEKKDHVKQNLMLRKQRKRIQKKNKSLHKTELCTHWMLTSTCNYKGKCYFAHGLDELRKRVRLSNFKTKPCVDCPPLDRRCLFGARCNYCHPGEAIRRALTSTYFDIDYYNDLKKDFKNNEYPFGIFI